MYDCQCRRRVCVDHRVSCTVQLVHTCFATQVISRQNCVKRSVGIHSNLCIHMHLHSHSHQTTSLEIRKQNIQNERINSDVLIAEWNCSSKLVLETCSQHALHAASTAQLHFTLRTTDDCSLACAVRTTRRRASARTLCAGRTKRGGKRSAYLFLFSAIYSCGVRAALLLLRW